MKRDRCPSCGAPSKGQFCEYCGTPLFSSGDAVNDARGKLCHVWYENDDGTIGCFDMFLNEIETRYEYTTLYADTNPYMDFCTSRELTFTGQLMDFDLDDWKKVVEWHRNRHFQA